MRTLVFTLVVTTVTVLLFGLLPAVAAQPSRCSAGTATKQGSVDRTRTVGGRTMVVAQVTLLVLLLTSADFFVRTLHFRTVDSADRVAGCIRTGAPRFSN